MTVSEVRYIIEKGDTNMFFKDIPSGEMLAKTIVRLSNEQGGTIIIGVDNNRIITGTSSKVVKESLSRARILISGQLNVFLDAVSIGGKKVSVIRVGKSIEKLRMASVLEQLNRLGKARKNAADDKAPQHVIDNPNQNGRPDPIHHTKDYPNEDITFVPSHINCNYGKHVETPCFDVDSIAKAFFDVIRQSSSETGNVCFLGVFGCWGRGKSYFLDRMRQHAKTSIFNRSYDFVTFNAWKYQGTPCIWAHLIHTLLKHKPWHSRMLIYFGKFIKAILLSISLTTIVGFAFYCAIDEIRLSSNKLSIFSVITTSAALIGSIVACLNLFVRVSDIKRGSYDTTGKLGVQYQSEQELEKIISRWNRGYVTNVSRLNPFHYKKSIAKLTERKVVLLVEDIDRCSDNNMIETIEALKLILDNPIIGQRLIVIASLDDQRLIDAYERHYSHIENIVLRRREAIEQLNKIFLISISLPKISFDEMHSYLNALIGRKVASIEECEFSLVNDDNIETKNQVSYHESNINSGNIISDSDSTVRTEMNINYEDTLIRICNVLNRKLRTGYYNKLTPRQVKILYYRLLFACNLVSDFGLVATEKLFDMVIDISLADTVEKKRRLSYTPLCKIIELCVPYQVCQSYAESKITKC